MQEREERIVVGVNRFQTEELEVPALAQHDRMVQVRQSERLAALRAERDGATVERALADIRAAARGDQNMMPLLIAAVEAYATIGEICGVLRQEWGRVPGGPDDMKLPRPSPRGEGWGEGSDA